MRKSKQNKMRKCESTGGMYPKYYRDGKYFMNRSVWRKWKKDHEKTS